MPLILPGNVATATASTGYEVANSCMFNAADSAYLTRTFGSAGNRQKWTFSTWCKRCKFGAQQTLFGTSSGSSAYHLFYWGSDDTLVHNYNGTVTNASTGTGSVFRDPSAWYHVVCAVDTTQGTAANRVKLYVNGVSVGSGSYPDEDEEMTLNNNVRCDVGSSGAHFTSHMLGGYLAETVFIDGTQYAASDFGEFDEDSPTIWKPKDVSGLTFGTNGFWFDYEASDNLGNDANGGTDWTENNLAATDQATDTCTNNFCVMNPLDNYYQGSTFSQGNLQVVMDTSGVESYNTGTFAVSKGKWYCEVKYSAASSKTITGVASELSKAIGTVLANEEYTWGYEGENGNAKNDGNGVSYGDSYTTNDIISIALDLTNNKVYFAKNGTWQNSGDPTSGATGTGAAHSVTAVASTRDGVYYFGSGKRHSDSVTSQWNFGGCPAFSISSGNADDNGYGNFEYDVPADYLSLCTKNLGSDGG